MRKILIFCVILSIVISVPLCASAAESHCFYYFGDDEALFCDTFLLEGLYEVNIQVPSQDVELIYSIDVSYVWDEMLTAYYFEETLVDDVFGEFLLCISYFPHMNVATLSCYFVFEDGERALVDLFDEGSCVLFTPASERGNKLISSVGSSLLVLLDWVGICLTSFISGALTPVLILFVVGTSVAIVFIVIKYVKKSKRGL